MAICLAPALWIARLTRDDRLPKRRAMFHVLGWGGYMTLVIPSVALSYTGKAMTDLYRLPVSITDWSLLAAGLLLLFVGIAATAEFARVGEGTPIPFDPPKRVVVSGPYALVGRVLRSTTTASRRWAEFSSTRRCHSRCSAGRSAFPISAAPCSACHGSGSACGARQVA